MPTPDDLVRDNELSGIVGAALNKQARDPHMSVDVIHSVGSSSGGGGGSTDVSALSKESTQLQVLAELQGLNGTTKGKLDEVKASIEAASSGEIGAIQASTASIVTATTNVQMAVDALVAVLQDIDFSVESLKPYLQAIQDSTSASATGQLTTNGLLGDAKALLDTISANTAVLVSASAERELQLSELTTYTSQIRSLLQLTNTKLDAISANLQSLVAGQTSGNATLGSMLTTMQAIGASTDGIEGLLTTLTQDKDHAVEALVLCVDNAGVKTTWQARSVTVFLPDGSRTDVIEWLDPSSMTWGVTAPAGTVSIGACTIDKRIVIGGGNIASGAYAGADKYGATPVYDFSDFAELRIQSITVTCLRSGDTPYGGHAVRVSFMNGYSPDIYLIEGMSCSFSVAQDGDSTEIISGYARITCLGNSAALVTWSSEVAL